MNASPNGEGARRLRALNALRFFAALAVFGAHLLYFRYFESLAPIFEVVLTRGQSGVTFFFILSGYILSHSYRDRLAGQGALRTFYLARFARIYPLHALTTLLAVVQGGAARLQAHWFDLAMSLFLVHAWLPRATGMSVYNPPSWSLAHEAFFYALFPLLLPAIYRARTGVALAAVALPTSVVVLYGGLGPDHGYLFSFFPPIRLLEFTVGILLYRIQHECEWPAASSSVATLLELFCIATIALTWLVVPGLPPNLAHSIAYVPAYVATIAVFSIERGAISRLLSSPGWFHLGEISYAFYLFHFLVLVAMQPLLGVLGPGLHTLAAFLVVLALSHASYTWFERPMRAWLTAPRQMQQISASGP